MTSLGLLIALLVVEVPVEGRADAPGGIWTEKLRVATSAIEKQPSADKYQAALDAAYRADAWEEGMRLAHEARKRFAGNRDLQAYTARALWRGGQVTEAEEIAAKISAGSAEHRSDAVALQVLLTVAVAKNELPAIERSMSALRELSGLRGADFAALAGAALATGRMEGVPELVRKALKHADPKEGYPEQFIEENLTGLAEFLEAIGPKPINHIAAHGAARMPVSAINLPICEAWINGKGPFRLIVDTGGSIMLSLDQSVADALKLPKYTEAVIRGVGGTSQSTQSLVEDLRMGDIRMNRVMTRVFDVSKAVMFSADGILGTGIFSDGRMTMDFEGGRLVVEPTSAKGAAGQEIPLRRIGDEKLITIVRMGDRPATALFDTGADAVAISPTALRASHPDMQIAQVDVGAMGVGSGADTNLSIGPGVKLELAGRTYPSISGIGLGVLDDVLSPMLGMHQDVLVGMPVFRECATLTVDFPACRMWMDWLAE